MTMRRVCNRCNSIVAVGGVALRCGSPEFHLRGNEHGEKSQARRRHVVEEQEGQARDAQGESVAGNAGEEVRR